MSFRSAKAVQWIVLLFCSDCANSLIMNYLALASAKNRFNSCLSSLKADMNHFAEEKALKRLRKAEARMNHIEKLLLKQNRSNDEEKKALDSLLVRDTYDSALFTESHRQFKHIHNKVFVSLALICAGGEPKSPVFYLDGAHGSTTKALRSVGWDEDCLFIANLFQDTAKSLKDSHNVTNVFVGRAEEALRSDGFDSVPFVAYYLDGCGGSSIPLLRMIDAIFSEARMSVMARSALPSSIAIGITLTESDSVGGRSLVDREQDVTRGLAQHALTWGLRMDYVGDDPGRYGLSQSPKRREGITQTIWLLLSRRA